MFPSLQHVLMWMVLWSNVRGRSSHHLIMQYFMPVPLPARLPRTATWRVTLSQSSLLLGPVGVRRDVKVLTSTDVGYRCAKAIRSRRWWWLFQSLSHVQFFAIPWTMPGSSVHGISQARILEWVAISFSRGSSWPRDQTHVSCIGRQILYHWATRDAWREGSGGAGGTKITARESEQPLWLSGQWRGWLKAAMPKGSVRDRITCQGPLPASKSWVYWGGFLEISQLVQRQCHCREAVVLLGECSGGQVTHKLKGPERSSQRGQILPGLWIWITTESQSVLQTLTRLWASWTKLEICFYWKDWIISIV